MLQAGGALYGRYPPLLLCGPDDTESEGRRLPVASVERYGATLARWFGVLETNVATVFPKLAYFGSSDLGFMVM